VGNPNGQLPRPRRPHLGDRPLTASERKLGCASARMSLDEASERVECSLDPAAHGDFPDDDEIPPTRGEVRPREPGAPATSLFFDRGGLGAEHHSVPPSAPTEERAEMPQPGTGVADRERPRNREMESVGGKDIANVLHSEWPPCCSTGVAAPTESEHHRRHRQPPTHAPSMTVQALRPWRGRASLRLELRARPDPLPRTPTRRCQLSKRPRWGLPQTGEQAGEREVRCLQIGGFRRGLESRYPSFGGSRVRIPPPPLRRENEWLCGFSAPCVVRCGYGRSQI
jgi:hypothetical protein